MDSKSINEMSADELRVQLAAMKSKVRKLELDRRYSPAVKSITIPDIIAGIDLKRYAEVFENKVRSKLQAYDDHTVIYVDCSQVNILSTYFVKVAFGELLKEMASADQQLYPGRFLVFIHPEYWNADALKVALNDIDRHAVVQSSSTSNWYITGSMPTLKIKAWKLLNELEYATTTEIAALAVERFTADEKSKVKSLKSSVQQWFHELYHQRLVDRYPPRSAYVYKSILPGDNKEREGVQAG